MEQRVTVEPSGKLLRMILSELSMQFVPLAVGDSIPVHTSSLPALVENVQFFYVDDRQDYVTFGASDY